MHNSTIANYQEQYCKSIANRNFANRLAMDGNQKDRELIQALADWTKLSPSEVARAAGLAVSTLTRPLNQPVKYALSRPTLEKLRAKYPEFPGWLNEEPDLPNVEVNTEYVSVEVLPTFAGMGGGGTGDDDRNTALVSRSLIYHELRGSPQDFLLINVRGDSMEPDFRHGDQILVDTRDTSPAQPGPFALWDGEWGEYVVKNVERAEGGRVRMFSTNTKYAASEIDHEATRIIGRPVWFARRL